MQWLRQWTVASMTQSVLDRGPYELLFSEDTQLFFNCCWIWHLVPCIGYVPWLVPVWFKSSEICCV